MSVAVDSSAARLWGKSKGISISTRFKMCENLLAYPHTRLSWVDFIANDARVATLQILAKLS